MQSRSSILHLIRGPPLHSALTSFLSVLLWSNLEKAGEWWPSERVWCAGVDLYDESGMLLLFSAFSSANDCSWLLMDLSVCWDLLLQPCCPSLPSRCLSLKQHEWKERGKQGSCSRRNLTGFHGHFAAR